MKDFIAANTKQAAEKLAHIFHLNGYINVTELGGRLIGEEGKWHLQFNSACNFLGLYLKYTDGSGDRFYSASAFGDDWNAALEHANRYYPTEGFLK